VNITMTLIGQSISFLFFVWFCKSFVWPPIINMMEERQKKIADGLEAADRAALDLELAQDKSVERLKEAKVQAAEIIDQAKKRSSQMIDEAKEQAREEGERLKTAAQAEIEQDINRAREELRAIVANLAIQGAEMILENSVDEKTNRALVEKLAAEL